MRIITGQYKGRHFDIPYLLNILNFNDSFYIFIFEPTLKSAIKTEVYFKMLTV